MTGRARARAAPPFPLMASRMVFTALNAGHAVLGGCDGLAGARIVTGACPAVPGGEPAEASDDDGLATPSTSRFLRSVTRAVCSPSITLTLRCAWPGSQSAGWYLAIIVCIRRAPQDVRSAPAEQAGSKT